MKFPKQFEYLETLFGVKGHPNVPHFITILDEFVHHYNGAKMFHIRIESVGYFTASPRVEYKTITEDELVTMLEKQLS